MQHSWCVKNSMWKQRLAQGSLQITIWTTLYYLSIQILVYHSLGILSFTTIQIKQERITYYVPKSTHYITDFRQPNNGVSPRLHSFLNICVRSGQIIGILQSMKHSSALYTSGYALKTSASRYRNFRNSVHNSRTQKVIVKRALRRTGAGKRAIESSLILA